MPTPLYHTTVIGGPTGISFTIGETLLFTSPEDAGLYVIDDPCCLRRQEPVAAGVAAFLVATCIEPRLMALGQRGTHGLRPE